MGIRIFCNDVVTVLCSVLRGTRVMLAFACVAIGYPAMFTGALLMPDDILPRNGDTD